MSQNTQNTSIDYVELVRKLAKPGQDIIATLTPDRAHKLHMAVGLMGEVVELVSAVANKDRENCIEELGDIHFYFTGLEDSFTDGELPEDTDEPQEGSLLFFAGEILDLVKKHTIYNKPFHAIDEKFIAAMVNFRNAFEGMMEEIGTDYDAIIAANIAKLNKRYESGYSDQAAQARADKKEGE